VSLYLDHCPDREWISACLRTGSNRSRPQLRPERVSELVALYPIPMVLHCGTGLTADQFADLISRGCAKVNISTALKIAFVDAHREYADANPGRHHPPSMLAHVRAAVKGMAIRHISMFGSAGRARPLVTASR
jgi:fructose-bisphosphate aldolase class II